MSASDVFALRVDKSNLVLLLPNLGLPVPTSQFDAKTWFI